MLNVLGPPVDCFPAAEKDRVQEAFTRYWMLVEDHDEQVKEHIKLYLNDRVEQMGPPNTSRNPVVAVCRALSTPGHYGRTPTLVGAGALAVAPLLTTLWPLKQQVEYLARGMICCATLQLWPDDGDEPVFEIVPSHAWYAEADDRNPRRPVRFYQLRVRRYQPKPGGEFVRCYAWDEWDATDPENPSFRVRVALKDGARGADITTAVGLRPMAGADYAARYANGRPFVPYGVHRSFDDGTMYGPWTLGRGAFRGALDLSLLNSYAMKLAYDSTGKTHFAIDFTIAGLQSTERGEEQITSLPSHPGDTVFGQSLPGKQGTILSVGGEGALSEVAAFAQQVAATAMIEMGVTPTDAMRASANPMSGHAISLTNKDRREEQLRQGPLCQQVDVEIAAQVAGYAVRAGTLPADPGAVTVAYTEIERSPEEERSDREGREWRVKMGTASVVDLFIEDHPGTTPAEAIAELARVAADRAKVDAAAVEAGAGTKGPPLLVGQIDAMTAIVEKVAARSMPRGSGIAALMRTLQCSKAEAEELLDDAGTDKFVPATPTT